MVADDSGRCLEGRQITHVDRPFAQALGAADKADVGGHTDGAVADDHPAYVAFFTGPLAFRAKDVALPAAARTCCRIDLRWRRRHRTADLSYVYHLASQ